MVRELGDISPQEMCPHTSATRRGLFTRGHSSVRGVSPHHQKGDPKMSIPKTRGFLYKLARLLGDFQAISSGSPQEDDQTGRPPDNRQGYG
jgi:hypothetical protein